MTESTSLTMEATGVAWRMVKPNAPLERHETSFAAGKGQALLEVVACGVCHTDVGFLLEGVRTRKAPPITLGHEIVGRVLSGPQAGRLAIVPAVMPCGKCRACTAGRSGTCPHQFMPGNDIDGGFASHVVVPEGALQVIDESSSIDGWQYAVVADAASTAWNAVVASGAGEGDTVIVIGAGGVGGYAAQAARARGARVLALDIDEERTTALAEHGRVDTLCTAGMDARAVRKAVQERLGRDRWGWTILECSGSAAGQLIGFNLLGPAGTMGVIGYTRQPVEIVLSRVMALEARLYGIWGCPIELYPDVIAAVTRGDIVVAPFVERVPMDDINDVIDRVAHHRPPRRQVLIP